MPSRKIEVQSKKLDGPADRPMTYDEITHFMRSHGECGRILLRDAADCGDLVDANGTLYQIVDDDDGKRSGHEDMICTKPLGHEANDPAHTFVTLLTSQCVWGPRKSS